MRHGRYSVIMREGGYSRVCLGKSFHRKSLGFPGKLIIIYPGKVTISTIAFLGPSLVTNLCHKPVPQSLWHKRTL